MLRIIDNAITFDDVLLLPAYSESLPKDVSLSTRLTRNITLNIPIISSAMDTVTESKMAISIATEGGLGVLHKNMPIEAQAAEVRAVKKFETGIVYDPITVTPDTTVAELADLTARHRISGVPVVAARGSKDLVGIVTSRDVRFETNFSTL